MKTKIKRILALIITLVLIVNMIPSFSFTNFSALGDDKIKIYMTPWAWDYGPPDGPVPGWGHPPLKYMNGWNSGSTNVTAFQAKYIGTDFGQRQKQVLYCVQPGVNLKSGNENPFMKSEDFLADLASVNNAITANDVHRLLGAIFQYGYTGLISPWNAITNGWGSAANMQAGVSKSIATQILIWETIVGERDADFNHINAPSPLNNIKEIVANVPTSYKTSINNAYAAIEQNVKDNNKIPSFMGPSRDNAPVYNWQGNSGSGFHLTLTDTNGVLNKFDITCSNSSVTVVKDGNNLMLAASSVPDGEIELIAKKTDTHTYTEVMFYSKNSVGSRSGSAQQGVVVPVEGEAAPAYAKLYKAPNVEPGPGSLLIVKFIDGGTSDPGKVFYFKYWKDDPGAQAQAEAQAKKVGPIYALDYDDNYTDEPECYEGDGFYVWDGWLIEVPNLSPGKYWVKEVDENGDDISSRYLMPSKVSVMVYEGEQEFVDDFSNTAVMFNTEKPGGFKINKSVVGSTNAEGFKFEVWKKIDRKIYEEFFKDYYKIVYNEETGTSSKVYYSFEDLYDIWTIGTDTYIKVVIGDNIFIADDGYDYGYNVTVAPESCIAEDNRIITPSNGRVYVDGLQAGEYIVKEIVPDGYGVTPANGRTTVIVKAGVDSENSVAPSATFQNTPQKGYFYIQKLIEGKSGSSLAGFKFKYQRIDISGQPEVLISTATPAGGLLKVGPLDAGTYKITEIGYDAAVYGTPQYLPSSREVQVKVGKEEQETFNLITVTNVENPGSLFIQKTIDTTNPNGDSLAGFKFDYVRTTPASPAVSGTIETGSDGKASKSDLPPGTYTITEKLTEEQAKKYNAPTSTTVTVTAGNNTEGTNGNKAVMNNTTTVGSLYVEKTIDTNNPNGDSLAGFIFEYVRTSPATPAVSGEFPPTNASGYASVSDLPAGTYKITEKLSSAQAKLYIAPDPKTGVVVTAGGKTKVPGNTAVMNNKSNAGGFKIVKTISNAASSTKPSGFKFNVYSGDYIGDGTDEHKWISGPHTTGDDGILMLDDLEAGTYKVKELTSGDYKALPSSANPKTVKVVAGVKAANATGESVVTFVNEAKEGKLIIKKAVASDAFGTFSLAGASFRVTGPDGYNQTHNITSGDFVTITGLKLGTYTVTEIKAPEGLLVDHTPYSVVVNSSTAETVNVGDNDVTVTKVIVDQPQLGRLKIIKKNSVTGKMDAAMVGTVLQIYPASKTFGTALDDEKQQIVISATDASNGYVYTKYLPLGEYKVQEITAPNGYLLNNTPETDNLIYDKTKAEATSGDRNIEGEIIIVNEPQLASIRIVKLDGSDLNRFNTKMIGAKFRIYPSGKTYESSGGNERDEITIASADVTRGYAETKLLPLGTYIVEEIEAPFGYVIDPGSEKTVILTYKKDGTNTPILSVNNFETATVVNYPQRGKFLLKKTSSRSGDLDSALIGTIFQVYPSQYTSYTEALSADSDNCQEIEFKTLADIQNGVYTKLLSLGSYTIKESKAPKGYLLNVISVSKTLSLKYVTGDSGALVPSDTNVVEASITNDPQYGRLRIEKINSLTGEFDAAMIGAKFQIYNASASDYNSASPDKRDEITITSANILTDSETGKKYIETKLLPLGTYKIQEITAPEGYLLNVLAVTQDLKYKLDDNGVPVLNEACYEYVEPIVNEPQMGKIHIKKTNSNAAMGDYSLSGAVFQIYPKGSSYSSALEKDRDQITTDVSGNASSKNLPLGTYIVKEVTAPNGFKLNTTGFEVKLEYTLDDNKAPILLVEKTQGVVEEPQTGRFSIVKINDESKTMNAAIIGTVIVVYPKGYVSFDEAAGEVPLKCEKITINQSHVDVGCALTKELPLGDYIIEEIQAPSGFTRDTSKYEKSLVYTKDALGVPLDIVEIGQQIVNKLQKAKITVYKTGVWPNTGGAYGEADIADGAEFEIRSGSALGTVVETLVLNGVTSKTSKELPLGTYYVVETKAPKGYVLDSTPQKVEIIYNQKNQDIEVLTEDNDPALKVGQTNEVVSGKIAITKYTDLKDPANPGKFKILEGARFQIYLKSAGSYEEARENEKAEIVTDASGYARTGYLPYGTYIIREIETPDDFELIDGELELELFEGSTKVTEINLQSHDQIYHYKLTNKAVRSELKILKVDAETKKTSALSGVRFEVWNITDTPAQKVVQEYDYEVSGTFVTESVDVFETNDQGVAELYDSLQAGLYEVREIDSGNGYLLNTEPVRFEVRGNEEKKSQVIEVKVENTPAKGKIRITGKTGAVLDSATVMEGEFGTQYNPQFKQVPLEGAKFDVYADEDIYKADRVTLAYSKGTKIDQIITSADGTGESIELYFGRYRLEEVYTPAPYVLPKEGAEGKIEEGTDDETGTARENVSIYITLTYKDKETPIVYWDSGDMVNKRQKVKLQIQKEMAEFFDVPFGINPIKNVVFGLFAAEDIKDLNGKVVIPQDMLIRTIEANTSGKFELEDELPFAKYYLKELRTNYYYELDDAIRSVDISYKGMHKETAVFVVNDKGNPIVNKLKTTRISIHKLGEVLTGFTTRSSDGRTITVPVYEVKPLAGATFNIIADEDIYDNGILVIKKGDIVDTLTTPSTGTVLSRPLVQGNYVIVETRSPSGFVVIGKKVKVSIDLSGDLTEIPQIISENELDNPIYLNDAVFTILTKDVEIEDERQKVIVNLKKFAEMPQNPPANYNPYNDILFGLYTGEEIKDLEGNSIIAAESLMEVIHFNSSGKGIVLTESSLPFGKYYVKELETAAGYTLDQNKYPFEFSIKRAGRGSKEETFTVDINKGTPIQNKLKTGSIRIVKSFENRTSPIVGVPFKVTGTAITGATFDRTFYTNQKGEIVIQDLTIGQYKVQELDTALTKGYKIAEALNVTVEADKTALLEIQNKEELGKLTIKKTLEIHEDQIDKPLDGIAFRVNGTSDSGKEIDEIFYTDEKGEILIDPILVGEYTITELPEESEGRTMGYVTAASKNVIITSNSHETVMIHNILQRGKLRIEKLFVRLMPNDQEPVVTIKEGIPFIIRGTTEAGINYDSGVLLTDADGIIELEDLPVGTYVAYEQESDLSKGYALVPETEILVTPNGTAAAKIENELKVAPSVRIKKTFEGRQDNPIIGVEFQITSVNTLSGVEYYKKGAIDKDGVLVFNDLPLGQYKIEEIDSDLLKGYVLSEPKYIEITEEDLKSPQTIEVNMHNSAGKGNLKIIKKFEGITTAEELAELAGIPFAIEGKPDGGEPYHATVYTDRNGIAEVKNLLIGEYTVREQPSEIANKYSLAPDQTVIIAAGEITEVNVENKLVSGEVWLQKLDGLNVTRGLHGAKFEVYADLDENGIFVKGSTKLIGTMTEENDAVHRMVGLPSGMYFVKEVEAPEGYAIDPGVYPFTISQANESAVICNRPGVGFVNVVAPPETTKSIVMNPTNPTTEPDTDTSRPSNPSGTTIPPATGTPPPSNTEPGGGNNNNPSSPASDNGSQTPVNGGTTQSSSSPKTSDVRNMFQWILLMVISIAGISVILVNPKAKQKIKVIKNDSEKDRQDFDFYNFDEYRYIGWMNYELTQPINDEL